MPSFSINVEHVHSGVRSETRKGAAEDAHRRRHPRGKDAEAPGPVRGPAAKQGRVGKGARAEPRVLDEVAWAVQMLFVGFRPGDQGMFDIKVLQTAPELQAVTQNTGSCALPRLAQQGRVDEHISGHPTSEFQIWSDLSLFRAISP